MTLRITIKGGKGSGWHAPPKGTHSGDKHRAVGSGKSKKPESKAKGSVKSAAGLNNMLNAPIAPSVPRYSDEISWENASDAERALVKDDIVYALLDESDDIDPGDAADYITQWSHSSNDNDMRSLAVQEDAAKEFGIPMSEFTQDKIDDVRAGDVHIALEGGDPTRPLMSSDKQREILRATYNNTQRALSDAGYGPDDSITLYRGVKLPEASFTDDQRWAADNGGRLQVSGNPLESWTIDRDIAVGFAIGGMEGTRSMVLKADIPVKNIVSTARTGIGCLVEGEVVVMGSVISEAEVD